ncbi:MAG TPA: DnaJ domain-containing protein [Candidatus Acidoferrales bacterium]|jgi:DnaJ-class molecular chaperone|nr:DnaJ domain-containing protein [Candidatus Acidoferrales bacterium]
MPTQAQSDDYEILGVPRSARPEQIKAAFEKLVTGFHAAGKPKNIDDVEWLRKVVHAYHALSDGLKDPSEGVFGFDAQRIEDMSRSVDRKIALRRSMFIANGVDSRLADFILAILT